MIIVGGAFLLAPGFITDVIGFALLIPPTRAVFRSVVARFARRRIAFGWAIPSSRPPAAPDRARPADRARGRPAATTTRAPRTRSTTRPLRSSRASAVADASRSSSRRPAARRSLRVGRGAGWQSSTRTRRPTPVWRLGGELDWDEIDPGPGALGAARRRPPAGDRGAAPGRRRGARRGAGRGRARSPGEFEQLDETLFSTEYGPDGAPAPGRARALRPRRRARDPRRRRRRGDRARRRRPESNA